MAQDIGKETSSTIDEEQNPITDEHENQDNVTFQSLVRTFFAKALSNILKINLSEPFLIVNHTFTYCKFRMIFILFVMFYFYTNDIFRE